MAIEAMYRACGWSTSFGQRQISSRETGAGVAGEARLPDQAAFHPGLLPHLNPIERLWGLMHNTPPTTSATHLPRFSIAMLNFLPATYKELAHLLR